MQTLVIDGSPRWEVYRTVPVEAPAGASGADGAGAAGRSEPAQEAPAQYRVGAPVSHCEARGATCRRWPPRRACLRLSEHGCCGCPSASAVRAILLGILLACPGERAPVTLCQMPDLCDMCAK